MEREIETKYLVSYKEYLNILFTSKLIDRDHQLNVYYDTPDWMLAHVGATARVRFGRCYQELTVKVPVSMNDDGTRTMSEFSRSAVGGGRWTTSGHTRPRRIIINSAVLGLTHDLTFLEGQVLERKGWTRTSRRTSEVDGVGVIELDRLTLPDGETVYEVEFESATVEDAERFLTWIRRAAPTGSVSRMSKFQRFREAVEPVEDAAYRTVPTQS